ncbi:MAG: hypothetical protein JRI76_02735 [Deltaproteobacteria bacterium]|nr:hypothetical protein [Deltaproteobacteria bacterium]MBW1955282.1 hypothetical protein [Deltaproteobacteria bacterium]MBW2040927.1 hypothetical protein [Deltaproteobacteria bacterium]MBW2130977.1 hypothetical protein [Deltaproteobacteria bacterium]
MSLSPRFQEALQLLAGLTEKERRYLTGLSRNISRSEAGLAAAAAPLLHRCTTVCKGLCCRNIVPDTLIDTTDFIFALSLDDALEKVIPVHLEKENPFYGTDCVFLEAGTGPCIFPAHLRPLVCITAFCANDHGIRKEIARVKWAFFRLEGFVRVAKIRRLAGRMMKVFSIH